jgi:hypothetical protein
VTSEHKTMLLMVLDDLFNQLKKNDFHSFYFDRTSKGMLCDKKGWFSCEGPFVYIKFSVQNTFLE